MGKQVKIISSDPILSKNFKYEKRKKDKLLEKMKSEEEKALELKRKKQMMDIERKVDSQIEQVTAHIPDLNRNRRVAQLKQQMLQKKGKQEKRSGKLLSNCANISLSTQSKISDYYKYHFDLKIAQSQIVCQQKKSKNKQIEEEARKQITQMFKKDLNAEQKEEIQVQDQEERQILNLALDCKKQVEIVIDSQPFHVTKNFLNNKQILSKGSDLIEEKSLNSAKMMIQSYFDHVFIENSQEQKIEAFREIVINHSTDHLKRCLEDEKGKGFTNCKILILTPFMGDARSIMQIIEQKFPDYSVLNQEKLEQIQDENDFFRIGLKIAQKKKQLSYFSNFDHSEIIIASPVGLKSIIGSEGDEKRENSFISSVQILYIDRASALLMQNWVHLNEILNNINIMPRYESLKNSIDTIRETFLELKGRIYRQSIVFSQYNFPQLNALKKFHFHNVQGGVTTKVFYQKPINTSCKYEQNFYKIQLKQPKDDFSLRFDYFKRKFWDDLHNKESFTKVVLFTNSYFQYIKLKSFLEKVNASAECICEHTPKSKVQSRLARFNEGQFRILLTTERAFYFQVCQVKKFHSLYFYSLPKNVFIYQDLIGHLQFSEMGVNRIVSIYTKYDMLILERIVGTSKALEMVREYCNNVSFVI